MKGLSGIEKKELIPDDLIFLGYRGSIAHGMYVPKNDPNSIDDKDLLACIVPPIENYFGLNQFGSRGTKEFTFEEYDVVTYELRKFIGLLEKGNPNVLSTLWLEPNYYINVTTGGQMLIDNRQIFVGKHVYNSFVGYAKGQLHRMTHNAYEGYMGEKRKSLVEKFGYDCKNAAHSIRLLRMAIEFLSQGKLIVLRPDASELLEIKRGEWSLEHVKLEADYLFKRAEEALIHSKLPDQPDHTTINTLCVAIAERSFYGL